LNTPPPFPGDEKAAAPYKGQKLRVYRVSLNDPAKMAALARKYDFVAGFCLHPALGVKAIDEKDAFYPAGTPVIVVRPKGGGVSQT
jgi:hypothetical protein